MPALQSEMIDNNLYSLGRDMLLILTWVGCWGALELVIIYLSANQRIQLILYIVVFLAGFISLLFVPPVDASESGHKLLH